ncbi:hypothetical protein [Dyadobacter sp. 3J3]|uniref:hypothetical protein n=1 Tax=Dyadobacter sp. 3J3 TaxID=2606600 RepID=UPI001356D581|nr:hypothetical protein [Dyadobacter sp. 3J3]
METASDLQIQKRGFQHSNIMKVALLIFLVIQTLHLQAQTPTQKIYHQTFADPSNFTIMSEMENKQPEYIFVIDSTLSWPANIFWSGWTGDETLLEIMTQPGEVHESYDPDYLYRDPVIYRLFSAKERVALRKRAGAMESKKISLKGKNYSTVNSGKDIKRFYVMTSEPVFTTGGNYAFIFFETFDNDDQPYVSPDDGPPYDSGIFGLTTIIFKKQPDQSWKKIKLINHLL